MTSTQKIYAGFIGASIIAVVIIFASYLLSQNIAMGSVQDGQGYSATTTRAFDGSSMASKTLRGTPGMLGSVIVTGANTGVINFYNATTSNVLLRTNNTASSSILIASLPASLAAGTYVFDANFSDGLYVDIIGTVATSTITYK